jgi:hypothetical protein
MDPFTLGILLVIFWGLYFFAAIVFAPFVWLWRSLGGNPQMTTKMVLGALAGFIFAYLFELPWVLVPTIGGAIGGAVLSKLL